MLNGSCGLETQQIGRQQEGQESEANSRWRRKAAQMWVRKQDEGAPAPSQSGSRDLQLELSYLQQVLCSMYTKMAGHPV